MTAAQFEGLAGQIKPFCDYLYLHIKGEPLLHPQLADLLHSAARHVLKVNLTTNGLLLPERAGLLHRADCLRQTNLSLQSYTPATHGALEPWLDQLVQYARQEAAQGRYTAFRLWTLPQSRQPHPLSREMLTLLEAAFSLPPGRLLEQVNGPSATIAENIYLSFERQFDWPGLDAPDYGPHGSCYGGREMVGILADGTLVPCCLDGEGDCALGNVLETPLAQLLESARLTAMAEGFRQRRVVEPLCRRCGYRTRFGGD